MTKRSILTVLFAIVALLRIGADAIGSQPLDYVVTPLATILVIAVAWTDPGDETDPYRRFVLAGDRTPVAADFDRFGLAQTQRAERLFQL